MVKMEFELETQNCDLNVTNNFHFNATVLEMAIAFQIHNILHFHPIFENGN